MDVSIVIPIYNEEENVDNLCGQLHATLSGLNRSYEVLLVDDGSQDATWEKLTACAEKYPCLELIRFRRNYGQTAAMSAGFHHVNGDIIVTLDADLQNDPADIPLLLDHMEKHDADVVSGWRKDRKDTFLSRRLPSMIANDLISRITNVHLHDYGCTLKAYRREVIENIQLYGEMHRFIPALASWVGGRIEEVVVRHHPRRFGKSKYGLSRIVRVVLDLITVKFLLSYSAGPMQIYGRLAGYFFLPGVILMLLMVFFNLLWNVFKIEVLGMEALIKRPFWVMISFLLIFLGMQFLSMGLLAELQTRTYHESQNKRTYVVKEKRSSSPAPTA